MKKIFLIFVSVVLSLAVILPGATAVMADSGKDSKAQLSVRAALMIRAPSKAEAGQPVTITVLGKYNHQPVAGAEVYALKTDKIANAADKKNYTTTAANYIEKQAAPSFFSNMIGVFNRFMGKGKADKVKPTFGPAITESESVVIAEEVRNIEQFQRSGISLGTTNGRGEMVYSFDDTGHYILAAFKSGYIPDFIRINIVLASHKALDIKAPNKAEVGQPVTITVFQRGTSQAVANAGVYALAATNNVTAVPSQRPTTLILTPKPTDNLVEVSVTAEQVKSGGIFLGNTNDKGQVTHTFANTGRYVLAAIKDGYLPGFARIAINSSVGPKALVIKAPAEAIIGEQVSIGVREKRSGEAVAQASIYALRLENMDTTNGLMFRADPPSTDITARDKFTASVKSRGSNIGSTDSNGILIYRFPSGGHYLLVAIKDGYAPDFARIYIKSRVIVPQKSKVTTSPRPFNTH